MIKLDMCLEELLPTVTNKAVIFLASAVSLMVVAGEADVSPLTRLSPAPVTSNQSTPQALMPDPLPL